MGWIQQMQNSPKRKHWQNSKIPFDSTKRRTYINDENRTCCSDRTISGTFPKQQIHMYERLGWNLKWWQSRSMHPLVAYIYICSGKGRRTNLDRSTRTGIHCNSSAFGSVFCKTRRTQITIPKWTSMDQKWSWTIANLRWKACLLHELHNSRTGL